LKLFVKVKAVYGSVEGSFGVGEVREALGNEGSVLKPSLRAQGGGYQRQVQVILISITLRPLLCGFVVGEVMPSVAAVVVLEPPSRLVNPGSNSRLLGECLAIGGVGFSSALTRLGLADVNCRRGCHG
jgi:hypothetical protein